MWEFWGISVNYVPYSNIFDTFVLLASIKGIKGESIFLRDGTEVDDDECLEYYAQNKEVFFIQEGKAGCSSINVEPENIQIEIIDQLFKPVHKISDDEDVEDESEDDSKNDEENKEVNVNNPDDMVNAENNKICDTHNPDDGNTNKENLENREKDRYFEFCC